MPGKKGGTKRGAEAVADASAKKGRRASEADVALRLGDELGEHTIVTLANIILVKIAADMEGDEHTDAPTNLDNYTNSGNNAYGTFFSQLSLETFKSNVDGESIFSGINCLGATVQCELVFGDANPGPLDLYFFATVDKILSMDPVTRSFIVSD